jgi:hypothetical protein
MRNSSVKQVFVPYGYVKGMLVYCKDIPVPVKNGTPHRVQWVGSNEAGSGDAFVFITLNNLELKKPGSDTGKKQGKDDEHDPETKGIHRLFAPDWKKAS